MKRKLLVLAAVGVLAGLGGCTKTYSVSVAPVTDKLFGISLAHLPCVREVQGKSPPSSPVDMQLYHESFAPNNRTRRRGEIIEKMRKKGLRPATAAEQISFMNSTGFASDSFDHIVALGEPVDGKVLQIDFVYRELPRAGCAPQDGIHAWWNRYAGVGESAGWVMKQTHFLGVKE